MAKWDAEQLLAADEESRQNAGDTTAEDILAAHKESVGRLSSTARPTHPIPLALDQDDDKGRSLGDLAAHVGGGVATAVKGAAAGIKGGLVAPTADFLGMAYGGAAALPYTAVENLLSDRPLTFVEHYTENIEHLGEWLHENISGPLLEIGPGDELSHQYYEFVGEAFQWALDHAGQGGVDAARLTIKPWYELFGGEWGIEQDARAYAWSQGAAAAAAIGAGVARKPSSVRQMEQFKQSVAEAVAERAAREEAQLRAERLAANQEWNPEGLKIWEDYSPIDTRPGRPAARDHIVQNGKRIKVKPIKGEKAREKAEADLGVLRGKLKNMEKRDYVPENELRKVQQKKEMLEARLALTEEQPRAFPALPAPEDVPGKRGPLTAPSTPPILEDGIIAIPSRRWFDRWVGGTTSDYNLYVRLLEALNDDLKRTQTALGDWWRMEPPAEAMAALHPDYIRNTQARQRIMPEIRRVASEVVKEGLRRMDEWIREAKRTGADPEQAKAAAAGRLQLRSSALLEHEAALNIALEKFTGMAEVLPTPKNKAAIRQFLQKHGVKTRQSDTLDILTEKLRNIGEEQFMFAEGRPHVDVTYKRPRAKQIPGKQPPDYVPTHPPRSPMQNPAHFFTMRERIALWRELVGLEEALRVGVGKYITGEKAILDAAQRLHGQKGVLGPSGKFYSPQEVNVLRMMVESVPEEAIRLTIDDIGVKEQLGAVRTFHEFVKQHANQLQKAPRMQEAGMEKRGVDYTSYAEAVGLIEQVTTPAEKPTLESVLASEPVEYRRVDAKPAKKKTPKLLERLQKRRQKTAKKRRARKAADFVRFWGKERAQPILKFRPGPERQRYPREADLREVPAAEFRGEHTEALAFEAEASQQAMQYKAQQAARHGKAVADATTYLRARHSTTLEKVIHAAKGTGFKDLRELLTKYASDELVFDIAKELRVNLLNAPRAAIGRKKTWGGKPIQRASTRTLIERILEMEKGRSTDLLRAHEWWQKRPKTPEKTYPREEKPSRKRLQSDVEKFLAKGGRIKELPPQEISEVKAKMEAAGHRWGKKTISEQDITADMVPEGMTKSEFATILEEAQVIETYIEGADIAPEKPTLSQYRIDKERKRYVRSQLKARKKDIEAGKVTEKEVIKQARRTFKDFMEDTSPTQVKREPGKREPGKRGPGKKQAGYIEVGDVFGIGKLVGRILGRQAKLNEPKVKGPERVGPATTKGKPQTYITQAGWRMKDWLGEAFAGRRVSSGLKDRLFQIEKASDGLLGKATANLFQMFDYIPTRQWNDAWGVRRNWHSLYQDLRGRWLLGSYRTGSMANILAKHGGQWFYTMREFIPYAIGGTKHYLTRAQQVALYEGLALGKKVDPAHAELVSDWRTLYDNFYADAKRSGGGAVAAHRTNYLPFRLANKWWWARKARDRAFVRMLQEEAGVDQFTAENTLNFMTRNKGFVMSPLDAIEIGQKGKIKRTSFGQMEQARQVISKVSPERLAEFADKDVVRLTTEYLRQGTHRLAAGQVFGWRNEKLNAALQAAVREASEAGAPFTRQELNTVRDMANIAQKTYGSAPSTWMWLVRHAMGVSNFALLGLVVPVSLIESFNGLTNPAMRRAYTEAFLYTAAMQPTKNFIRQIYRARPGQKTKMNLGHPTEETIVAEGIGKMITVKEMDLATARHGADVASKYGNAAFVVNGLHFLTQGFTHAQTRVFQNSLTHFAKKELEIRQGRAKRSPAHESNRRMFESYGMNTDSIVKWQQAGAKKGGAWWSREYAPALIRYLDETVLTARGVNQPRWHSNPVFAPMKHLMTYVTMYGNTVAPEIFNQLTGTLMARHPEHPALWFRRSAEMAAIGWVAYNLAMGIEAILDDWKYGGTERHPSLGKLSDEDLEWHLRSRAFNRIGVGGFAGAKLYDILEMSTYGGGGLQDVLGPLPSKGWDAFFLLWAGMNGLADENGDKVNADRAARWMVRSLYPMATAFARTDEGLGADYVPSREEMENDLAQWLFEMGVAD